MIHPRFWQPLDRAALISIFCLSLAIAILIGGGDHTVPRVRSFTWQDRQVGSDDTAFILTFSQPMNPASVEANLRLDPPLPGRISWAGRRMAYTLNAPAPYGRQYHLHIDQGIDRLGRTMPPYAAQFASRERAFAYVGVEGEERGRLLLHDFQNKTLLTPAGLIVKSLRPYPQRDRILFAAVPESARDTGLLEQRLYSVTTGIQIRPPETVDGRQQETTRQQPAGIVTELVDSQDYQNLKFDLSPDGSLIVVQRLSRTSPGDAGLWLLRQGQPLRKLKTEVGGDFRITPDGGSVAMSVGQGLAIVPLHTEAEALDFLPKFGQVLSFAQDGSLAVMVKFNSDGSQSLFLVSAQGSQRELLRAGTDILSAFVDPTKRQVYALLSEVVDPVSHEQRPHLARFDLRTGQRQSLLQAEDLWGLEVQLAPDGLSLLYSKAIPGPADEIPLQNDVGTPIASSTLWILPTQPGGLPQLLPFRGLDPHWLP